MGADTEGRRLKKLDRLILGYKKHLACTSNERVYPRRFRNPCEWLRR